MVPNKKVEQNRALEKKISKEEINSSNIILGSTLLIKCEHIPLNSQLLCNPLKMETFRINFS